MIYSLLCEGGSLVYSGGSARLLKNPLVSSDFIWDEDDLPTLWIEADSKETHWDNGVHMRLEPPTVSFWFTGPVVNFKIERNSQHKEYWLEAGGVCGMWLEDDNRTYTEWWDEITSTTPWDQGKTPWDTKNDIDTAWDEVGTGEYEKTYWYDFEAIGEFLFEGQNAGRGYTLHAVTGEFNVVGNDTHDRVITRRFRTGSFVFKGIRAIMYPSRAPKLEAEAGTFTLNGGISIGRYVPRGTIDHILHAEPVPDQTEALGEWDNGSTIWEESINGTITLTEWWDEVTDLTQTTFSLNGGESKGKYREGGCVRNPTEWDKHNPNLTDWDTHNVRETWWDTHKLRCINPEPATFILTGMDVDFDDAKHLQAGAGAFFVGDEDITEWDSNTTIWQEDDGVDTEWYDLVSHTHFHLAKYTARGKFLLAGYEVNKNKGYNLKANNGEFTLTGQEVILNVTIPYRITPAAGAFTLTGNTASGYVGGYAYPGEFTVSGQDIGSQRDRLLKAQPRHFKLSGMPSESTIQKIFYVGSTSYTLTGMDVSAKVKGGSKTGEFILTGQEASRGDSVKLSASTGVFNLTGNNAGVRRVLYADDTSFTVTGYSANSHYTHINRAGKFIVQGYIISQSQYPTLKVTEAGSFILKGSSITLTHGRSTLEGTSFVVDGQPANTVKGIVRTHEPTHYVLEGYEIDCGYEEREQAKKGTFHFYGKDAFLKHTQHHEVSLNSAIFVINGRPTEQDRNQSLSAETGHFVVKYDCDSKTLKAKTGEFELSGVRAVFNSKHYSFHAGPEAQFRVELQTVGRYGNHYYGKTLEYKLTGSDVFFSCGDVNYTRWDSLNTNWDVFKTLWDKKYGADKPCPIRPATVIPAHFELNGSKISGYTQDTVYPRPFECGHFTLEGGSINNVWEDGTIWIDTTLRKAEVVSTRFFETEWEEDDGTDTRWDTYANTGIKPPLSAETGHFRVELTHVGYQTDAIGKTTEFTLTGNESRGFWYKAELEATLWDEDDGFTVWEDPETLWYDPTGIGSIDEVLPENRIAAETGEFNINGQDSEGDYWKKPANVIMLASHREYKLLNCEDNKETFWDKKYGTEWFDKCYGVALWDSDTEELAVKWDENDFYRTKWDNDKSRWDKKRCTQLNLDYYLVANCK